MNDIIRTEKSIVQLGERRTAPTILLAWQRCSERTLIIEGLYRAGLKVRAETTRWGVLEQLEHGNCDLAIFDTVLDDAASIDVIMLWNMAHVSSGAVQIAYLGGDGERVPKDPGRIGISTFLRKPVTQSEIIDNVMAAVPFRKVCRASGFGHPPQWVQRETR